MILDIDNKKNAIGTKEYPDNYHDYKDEENYDVDKEPSTLEEWEAMQGDEQQPIGNVSERGDSQLQSTRQDNAYKRTNTLPPSTEAADTYWQWAKDRDKEIRRNNPRDYYKTIADYYLRNNPQPTLPEDDIKAERRRANFAMLSEALHLLVDIGSAVGGGNVYKREPHALRAVLDSKGRREALMDSYRRNLSRWQDAYAKVIGDASQEDRDRTIDIFRTIYPAYTSLDKEMLRQDNRLELEAEKQKNALERQERAQKAKKALEDYKNNLKKDLYRYKKEQMVGVWFPGETKPVDVPIKDLPFYNTLKDIYITEMGLPHPIYDKRSGKWVSPTKTEVDTKKSENMANMNSGQMGATKEYYGGTVNLNNPKAGTQGGNNQGKKPKKPF
nr:MAG TPA: hypothetical protein [Caudoviricetes sp.]